MTTERIDVLAVMDMHLAAMAAGRSNVPCANLAFYDESRKQFEQARAAVAELIELGRKVSAHDYTFMPGTQWADMNAFRAALARCGVTP